MVTKVKSENDTRKEANEEKCFQLAVEAAHKRGGDTDKILSYLNGQNIDTRSKGSSRFNKIMYEFKARRSSRGNRAFLCKSNS